MMHFTVDDQQATANGCVKCCCEKLSLKPGTTSKVSVGYAPWAVPIGQLHCAPQFMIEQMETCPVPVGGNMPPQLISPDQMVRFDTGPNVVLTEDFNTKITDPEDQPMTYKVLPLYGPKHGKMVLAKDGTFTYTPNSNFVGEERFYVSVSDGTNEVIFETLIAVGIDAGTMTHTPHISIGPGVVDQKYFTVYFPITVSPAAQLCEVWRLTVLQGALDCECICYTRTDCFDIGIAKC